MDPKNADKKRLGRLLKSERKAAGLTQEELGEIVGVHRAAVSSWERGVAWPSTDARRKLVDEEMIPERYRRTKFQLFADIFRTSREVRGLNAEEAADLLNVSRGSIYRWESGCLPNAKNIRNLIDSGFLTSADLARSLEFSPREVTYLTNGGGSEKEGEGGEGGEGGEKEEERGRSSPEMANRPNVLLPLSKRWDQARILHERIQVAMVRVWSRVEELGEVIKKLQEEM